MDGTATSPPGDKFRAMRRFMTRILGPHAVKKCVDVEDAEVAAFLRRAVRQPGEVKAQLQR